MNRYQTNIEFQGRVPALFVLAGIVGSFITSQSAQAASVTFKLVIDPVSADNGCVGCTLTGAGTWDLFASASAGDNVGIARYKVSLANATSILHRSPRTSLSTDPNGVDPDPQPAGFSLLRSANDISPILASLDTVTPTPYIIRHFGQTASSFVAQYPDTFTSGSSSQHTAAGWAADVLIAEGAYLAGVLPAFEMSPENVAGVLTAATGEMTQAAELDFVVEFAVPEPSMFALIAISMLAIPWRRRAP